MNQYEIQRATLLKHKRWADFWSALSIVLSIGLFAVVGFVMDGSGASADDRVGAYALLSTVIVGVTIWQAVALGIARLELALKSVGR
jgi:hypothetical protein